MIWAWLGFFLVVAVLLALDLGVFNREAHAVSAREAITWTFVWIGVGTAFTGVVYLIFEHGWMGFALLDEEGNPLRDADTPGLTAATRYITAYLLEKSLSVDNIFVIALIFQRFEVEPKHRHRVLFWGVLGAVVLRAIMLLGGLWLLHRFSWLFYVFGAYLAYTGLSLLKPETEEVPVMSSRMRKLFRVAPLDAPHNGKLVIRIDGKRMLTLLGLALVTIEWTDVVFALDSIPAVLAVAPEPFIVYTSNIFAILGLRSLYFVLDNAVARFKELRYALAAILVFIGVKMIGHSWFHIPNWASLLFIVSALMVAIGFSYWRARLRAAERGAVPTTDEGDTAFDEESDPSDKAGAPENAATANDSQAPAESGDPDAPADDASELKA